MKKIISILLIFSILLVLLPFPSGTMANAKGKLTASQEALAEELADICTKNWDKYGVLPSVCIGQAFVESTLGEHNRGYNYWGINSGNGYNYSSVKEGCLAYCKVINNGYYKNAPFQTNPYKQIRSILDGGYCQPEGAYYSNFCYLYEHYNLGKYDKLLKYNLKHTKLTKFASECPENSAMVNPELARYGTVSIWYKDVLMYIYDVVPDPEVPKDEIWISKKKWTGRRVVTEFNRKAKG